MEISRNPIGESTLFCAEDGVYTAYRIPGIIATDKGTLLTCCEGRSAAKSDWGTIDVLIARSIDEGAHWNVVNTISDGDHGLDNLHTYNNPTLIADGERVHLIYHRNYEQAYVIHSMDDGQTWSSPEEITDTFTAFDYAWNVCATGPGHGIRTDGGRLVAPVWLANGLVNRDGTKQHSPSAAGYIYSDDRGQTWQAGALAPGLKDGNETSVAQTSKGNLLFNFRTKHEARKRFIGILIKGEEIFAATHIAKKLDDPMCFGSMASLPDGRIAFVNCANPATRTNLSIHLTEDEGSNWQREFQVDPMGGYADIAWSGNRLYVFFERYSLDEQRVLTLTLKTYELR